MKWNKMTIRTRVLSALGLVIFLLALAVGGKLLQAGSPGPAAPAGSAEAAELDCLEAAQTLINAGETELGFEMLETCLRKNPSLKMKLKNGEEGAAAAFESLLRGWSAPWPDADGVAQTALSAAALAEKLAGTEKFLENYPSGYHAGLAVVLKALILYQRGKYDACLRWLNQNSADTAMPDFSMYLSALAAWKSGQADTALGYANHTVEEHPESPFAADAEVLAAKILTEKGNYAAAADRALKTAATAATPAARGRALLAASAAFLAAGDRVSHVKAVVDVARLYPDADAADFLEKNLDLKNDPLSPDDLLALARYFDAKDRGYPTIQMLSPMSKLPPEGIYLLARAYTLNGDYSKALKLREKLAGGGVPEDVQGRSCLLLGRIYDKKKKPDDALRTEAYERSARINLLRQDEDNQARVLEKLLAADPDHRLAPDALLLVARFYLARGDTRTAEKFYEQLAREHPESYPAAEALLWLGKFAYDHYDFDRSGKIFTNLRERFPYSYSYFRAADYLSALDKKPETMAALVRRRRGGYAFYPASGAPLRTAHALRHLNVYQPALEIFRLASKEFPNEAAAGAARALRDSGDITLSIKTIEERAKVDPEFYQDILGSPDLTELLFPKLFLKETGREAAKYKMHGAWPMSIIRQESRFKADARSSSNALGLMQIIPSTGKWIAKQLKVRYPGDKAMYDPETNISYGVWYFDYLLELDHIKGNYALALAAYNGGPGNVRRWKEKYGLDDIDVFIEKMPRAETRGYVKKVMLSYYVYEALLDAENIGSRESGVGSRGKE